MVDNLVSFKTIARFQACNQLVVTFQVRCTSIFYSMPIPCHQEEPFERARSFQVSLEYNFRAEHPTSDFESVSSLPRGVSNAADDLLRGVEDLQNVVGASGQEAPSHCGSVHPPPVSPALDDDLNMPVPAGEGWGGPPPSLAAGEVAPAAGQGTTSKGSAAWTNKSVCTRCL